LGILALMLSGTFITVQAQIDSTVKKVGDKTAQTAVKGKSAMVEEVFKN